MCRFSFRWAATQELVPQKMLSFEVIEKILGCRKSSVKVSTSLVYEHIFGNYFFHRHIVSKHASTVYNKYRQLLKNTKKSLLRNFSVL